jgi:hypothetical protein
MNEFKENLGEVAYKELQKLIKAKLNIKNLKTPDDLILTQKALELLMEWLGSVYDISQPQREALEDTDDVDFNQMFKIK